MVGGFSSFVADLQRQFGSEAAAVRHELYFLGKRPWAGGRAAVALLRDAALLSARAGVPVPNEDGLAVMVATLAGGSGWGTLALALDAVRRAGLRPVVLAHPRLDDSLFPKGVTVCRPVRPAAAEIVSAVAGVAGGMVAATVARRRLWSSALARSLGRARGWLVLHNDFDMMSGAAQDAGWPSVCLQHGIPTDEFFPVRADRYVMWGASSARAFAGAGLDSDRLVQDALGRARPPFRVPQAAPQGVALISQTHAAILGDGLAGMFRDFAVALQAAVPECEVLLHPQEVGRDPYAGLAGLVVRTPPHALLREPAVRPRLVLGYCSTAMVDAALAGHWVAGVELGLPGNAAARAVAVPPLRVGTPGDAAALLRRLAEDGDFRGRAAALQRQWLGETFASSEGGLERLLRDGRAA
ncbi:MAG TPA: hypothetical protein VK196_14095 [Magnetospirillum sp.]|nr:hypothetical protein [Magnetospirillum sp.]